VSNIEKLSRDEIRRRIGVVSADNQHSAEFEAQASGPELITRRASEVPIEPVA
jgi:hypothetical protein